MRHVDFSPLYRSTVGFDRLVSLLDQMSGPETAQNSYPPYNIERLDENAYRISIAVAGFDANDISIESKQSTLTVKGQQGTNEAEDAGSFLYRGIAARNFERRFQLADYVEVTSANLENGLLHIDLVREIPEAMKPRKIEITAAAPKTIEGKAA